VGKVAALHALSRQVTYRGIIPARALRAMTTEELRWTWTERVTRESGTHRLYLAEVGGELRGFSYVGPGDEVERVPRGTGVLYAIHVHPDAQGTGIGSAMMDLCLRTFADWRYASAVLWVLDGNHRACRFYERTGWRHDGTVRESAIGRAVTRQLRYVRPVGNQPMPYRSANQS
jgi:ribosomal protein S18 acetylase RimI-like enzyme